MAIGNIKKALCLSWAENHGLNPLIKNQLISQLSALKQYGTGWDIDLVLATPILSKKSVTNRKRYFHDIHALHTEARSHGVDTVQKWLMIPSTFFHSRVWQLPFIYIFNILPFTFFMWRKQYDIVHCRSYHSTIAALLAKKIGRLKYQVIFDTRGLFPEESVYHRHFTHRSLSFKVWKRLEKWALTKSDCIVNVSEAFTDHIRSIVPNHKNIETIYTTANETLFQNAKKPQKIKSNKKQSPLTLCYLGVLGPGSWYSIKRLAALTLEAKRQLGEARLKIITRNDHTLIMQELIKHGLSQEDVTIMQTLNATETASALLDIDVATVPVRPLSSEIDQLIMNVLIGAKTAEYLANGIPIITYSEAEGIAKMVLENQLGQVATEGKLSALDFSSLQKARNLPTSHIKDFALQNFSASSNAQKYIEIYQRLATQCTK